MYGWKVMLGSSSVKLQSIPYFILILIACNAVYQTNTTARTWAFYLSRTQGLPKYTKLSQKKVHPWGSWKPWVEIVLQIFPSLRKTFFSCFSCGKLLNSCKFIWLQNCLGEGMKNKANLHKPSNNNKNIICIIVVILQHYRLCACTCVCLSFLKSCMFFCQ